MPTLVESLPLDKSLTRIQAYLGTPVSLREHSQGRRRRSVVGKEATKPLFFLDATFFHAGLLPARVTSKIDSSGVPDRFWDSDRLLFQAAPLIFEPLVGVASICEGSCGLGEADNFFGTLEYSPWFFLSPKHSPMKLVKFPDAPIGLDCFVSPAC